MMKNIISKICLPVALGFMTTASIAAAPMMHSFGKGVDNIHVTHFHGDPVLVRGYLYKGTKSGQFCGKLVQLAQVEDQFGEGSSIAADSELFETSELNPNSCAIEKFVLENGNMVAINYKLINDGKTVTAADPNSSDVTFPTLK